LPEGSGLGLAISKAYIEILGGKIWVKVKKEMAAHFILPYISI
jgi:signal transduction histidine kinase